MHVEYGMRGAAAAPRWGQISGLAPCLRYPLSGHVQRITGPPAADWRHLQVYLYRHQIVDMTRTRRIARPSRFELRVVSFQPAPGYA